ncbi:hypothetical protein HacjB3_19643 (plasmid) [Halalkalicoccus jeotgali B3]|uniref:Uncharacterized protein n=1 Tax=Halalkalicoccus jeotgali (strain DSM 18796 / CECT 7217 / JCM 14584 / KCTC 4019 / B3) TaxID=795797 RepID=D8JDB1_HALJB|nr:hypothetical protein HacjB3_19643 [Halalkalicoccus jeotgali B3]
MLQDLSIFFEFSELAVHCLPSAADLIGHLLRGLRSRHSIPSPEDTENPFFSDLFSVPAVFGSLAFHGWMYSSLLYIPVAH